ncbi:MAG: hypothetical protein P4L46_14475 [Fimbriimonas sp.]|nr:hypothetical protein [Fimbriimonas sp.]
MARERIPVPMFEAFLAQAQPPDGDVLPKWVDWTSALLVLAIFNGIHGGDVVGMLGIIGAYLVWTFCKKYRKRQVAQQPPEFQAAYERWNKIRVFVHHNHHHDLYKRVPTPVLLALESAARTWHDAKETLLTVSTVDPSLFLELGKAVDAAMMAATSLASPVLIRDDQSKKDVQRLEADTSLMAQVVARIRNEELRILTLTSDIKVNDGETRGAMIQRLELARAERAKAEAELDALI